MRVTADAHPSPHRAGPWRSSRQGPSSPAPSSAPPARPRARRIVVATLALATSVLPASRPAWAELGEGIATRTTGAGVEVEVSSSERGTPPRPSEPDERCGRGCHTGRRSDEALRRKIIEQVLASLPGVGTTVPQGSPGQARPSPVATLAAMAVAELRIGAPQARTAPPRHGVQLVGVDVWTWVEGARPLSATASIPGLSATATAAPSRLEVRVDGHLVASCRGAGAPFATAGAGTPRAGACTSTFEVPGRHRVTATLLWSIRWRASDGRRGALADVARSSSFTLAVAEGRGLTD